jgi:hypothetical protein
MISKVLGLAIFILQGLCIAAIAFTLNIIGTLRLTPR